MIRQIFEKGYEYAISVHSLFIDFKQAFDTVDTLKLCQSLRLLRIPSNLIKLVQVTLYGSKAAVVVQRIRIDNFEIDCGVIEGNALSTLIFKLILHAAVSKVNAH